MAITDLEMLVLADVVYERFEPKNYKEKEKYFISTILKNHKFQTPLRKARWEAVSEKMKDWKLIDAFDLVTYGETMGLSEEEL